MKSTGSITADEKKLLDYMYEKACDIADYLHRNGMNVPVSIMVHPDYEGANGDTYDYMNATFSEDYESGHVKRIASLNYNYYNDRAEYNCTEYEDKEEE